MDVKDNSEEQNSASLTVNSNCLAFTVAGLTLEHYRESYEGKLVQLCWMDSFGGYHVTIKAPVYEE